MNKIYKDNKNNDSWGKILITSDDNSKKVTILWCATEEYIDDNDFTPEKLGEIIENKWGEISKKDKGFFNQKIYYDAYCDDPKNKMEILEFLKSIKP